MRRMCVLVALFVAFLCQYEPALARDKELTLFVGEAYFPSHLRLTYRNFNAGLSISGMSMYAGGLVTRNSKYYTGIGLGYGYYGFGTYATLGCKFLPLNWLVINAEFFGFGTIEATVMASGLIGLGLLW